MTPARHRLVRVLAAVPALTWTAVISWFSTDRWGASSTRPRLSSLLGVLLPWLPPDAIEVLHVVVRKGGHVTEYGILAALWSLAIRGWRWPLGLCVLTAFLDELHQATTLTREGSAGDVLLDSAAAAAALALVLAARRRRTG